MLYYKKLGFNCHIRQTTDSTDLTVYDRVAPVETELDRRGVWCHSEEMRGKAVGSAAGGV